MERPTRPRVAWPGGSRQPRAHRHRARRRSPGRREIAALLALALAVGVFAERDWAQHVIPQLALLCLAVAVACLVLRLRYAALAWAVPAAVGLAQVAPDLAPRLSVPRPGCTITVTFNRLERGSDDAAAARLLGELHPDVLFVQRANDAEGLRDLLQQHGFAGYDSLPASPTLTLIMSRFPIARSALRTPTGSWAEIAVEGRQVRLHGLLRRGRITASRNTAPSTPRCSTRFAPSRRR